MLAKDAKGDDKTFHHVFGEKAFQLPKIGCFGTADHAGIGRPQIFQAGQLQMAQAQFFCGHEYSLFAPLLYLDQIFFGRRHLPGRFHQNGAPR